MIQGGTTIVAQGRTNNIGGDAVEVLAFANTTGTTQFDVLITSAGGPLPGTIKYVDFSNGTTFNEYLTNSSTTFGHANATGAVSVGAASFLSTPAFGTTPPVVETFSALGGTPIIFNQAGVRLTTPEVRQKTDLVGPDGVNTTFFGTDIAGDADAFPNFFGTSAAAPHVAALTALMLQTNPNLTVPQIAQILDATAIGMDNPYVGGFQTGFGPVTGLGLVDGVAATETTLGTRGDFNHDQNVDGADFLAWQRSFGQAATPVGSGADGDLSGTIGSGDLTIWKANFGQTLPAATATVVAQSVPLTAANEEPSIQEAVAKLPSNLLSTAVVIDESESVVTEPMLIEWRSSDIALASLPPLRVQNADVLSLDESESEQFVVDDAFESIGDEVFAANL